MVQGGYDEVEGRGGTLRGGGVEESEEGEEDGRSLEGGFGRIYVEWMGGVGTVVGPLGFEVEIFIVYMDVMLRYNQ